MQSKWLAAALAASIFSAPAQGAAILGLFNTGTDANNMALVGGNGLVDPHYTIISTTSSPPYVVPQQARTYTNGAYLADDANSRWISLTGDGTPVNNTTVYRLSFDLTGYDSSTAQVTGNFGTDNRGIVLLNGVDTGNFSNSFTVLQAFVINSGFVPGVNHLDFRVVDVGVVTAMRVDNIAGTANVSAVVPEPESWALMIAGFGLIGFALRRRRLCHDDASSAKREPVGRARSRLPATDLRLII